MVDAEGRITGPVSGEGAPIETEEAATIVERARTTSEEMLRAAAERAAGDQNQAYHEGVQQGYRDGVGVARAELAEALALVQHVAGEAKAIRDRMVVEAEREIVELAVEIARTILGEQVRLDPDVVRTTVQRAMARAGALAVVRIRVNPSDQEIVLASVVEGSGQSERPWEIVADGAIAAGGCIVDTAHGEIEARLDVQLDHVAQALRELTPEQPAERHDDAA